MSSLTRKIVKVLADEDADFVQACSALSLILTELNMDRNVGREMYIKQMALCWDTLERLREIKKPEDYTLQ